MSPRKIRIVGATIAALIAIAGAVYRVLPPNNPQPGTAQTNPTGGNNSGAGGQIGVGQNSGSITVNSK
jgi:hypothetical protein